MKISLQMIKQLGYHKLLELPLKELIDKIDSQLGAIESAPVDLGSLYQGILVVKVVSCHKHPEADKLTICLIDDGRVTKDVKRDSEGLVQVVCGAPNVRAGLSAIWLPPGTVVPSSFGASPFRLEVREIRGQISNGMLGSPHELGVSDDQSGILELSEPEFRPQAVLPGTEFKQLLGLDDVILEIENKMFTHRPDCFGLLGLAREIAGIQNQPFKSPAWYQMVPDMPTGDGLKLALNNELPELAPRFVALAIKDLSIKPSPIWLQSQLYRLGIRPINNVVDSTNYLMLLSGQPLHAYDYDKVKALDPGADQATLVVRNPKPNEKLSLLNGKTITPDPKTLLIASGQAAIGLAGVMGGSQTEVDNNTKNIILECATFDMYSIRRTAMAQGLFSDAVTRFTKGQSPLQNLAVILKALEQITELAGGSLASPVIDLNHLSGEVTNRGSLYPPVTVSTDFINARLGSALDSKEIQSLLQNVEFEVTLDQQLSVQAPFWRTDIELREDVVEEVGRLYGYHKLALQLPKRDLMPVTENPSLALKTRIRNQLSRAGANELLSYSFIDGGLLDKSGQNKDLAFQLANALSPELQYYRLSLTPSLAQKVHPNIKAGYDQFALFELGKTHAKSELDEAGLPIESERLGLIFAAEPKLAAAQYSGAAYYQALHYAQNLLSELGGWSHIKLIPATEVETESSLFDQMLKPFDPKRSSVLYQGSQLIGIVGEYNSTLAGALKLPDFCAGFELLLSGLSFDTQRPYLQLSRFPSTFQDICLKVPAGLAYAELFDFLSAELAKIQPPKSHAQLTPLDIYSRPDDLQHKQMTWRLEIVSYQKTMTDQEVNSLLDSLAESANQKFAAERV
ncbi:MAG TPA: phenylalanine--tRNA ligase subunit beta [Candidatus Dormibacteraeota bacterium]|nr:phenylalanine--tRNA ligase subunit beta [Candidatus Dormibacteraeota bacterium]